MAVNNVAFQHFLSHGLSAEQATVLAEAFPDAGAKVQVVGSPEPGGNHHTGNNGGDPKAPGFSGPYNPDAGTTSSGSDQPSAKMAKNDEIADTMAKGLVTRKNLAAAKMNGIVEGIAHENKCSMSHAYGLASSDPAYKKAYMEHEKLDEELQAAEAFRTASNHPLTQS